MTSNTMPATQYKDPKKYMWLLSVIAPFAAPLGPIMYLYTGHTQWLWIFLAFFYLGLPVLDFVFGEDKQNPPEQAVPELENTKYYRVITYLLVPIITFGFFVQRGFSRHARFALAALAGRGHYHRFIAGLWLEPGS